MPKYEFGIEWHTKIVRSTAIHRKCSTHQMVSNLLFSLYSYELPCVRKTPQINHIIFHWVYSNCDGVILPKLEKLKLNIAGKEQEFCPRCECKYENRNTTIIKVVVIIVIWVISLLVVYMLFLICLDPLLNKRIKNSYQEHTNEDVCSTN